MTSIFSFIVSSALTVIFLLFVVRPVGRRLFLVMADSGDSGKLISVNYEVYGKVQGVFFRKYTNLKARELKLIGWVKNTDDGTVVGNLQGAKGQVDTMKKWLRQVGSPHSTIRKCVFTDEEEITQLDRKSFQIIRIVKCTNSLNSDSAFVAVMKPAGHLMKLPDACVLVSKRDI